MRHWVYFEHWGEGPGRAMELLRCECIRVSLDYMNKSVAFNTCCRKCYGTGIVPTGVDHFRLHYLLTGSRAYYS